MKGNGKHLFLNNLYTRRSAKKNTTFALRLTKKLGGL